MAKTRSLLITLGRVLLFVVLLILPTLLRAGYYYRRYYVPRAVPRPDHTDVDVATGALSAFADVSKAINPSPSAPAIAPGAKLPRHR